MHVILGTGFPTQDVILRLHPFAWKIHDFFFRSWTVFHCVDIPLFLYPLSVGRHLVCFKVLAIMNKAAINIVEHVSLWDVGASLGYMPSTGIADSWYSGKQYFHRNASSYQHCNNLLTSDTSSTGINISSYKYCIFTLRLNHWYIVANLLPNFGILYSSRRNAAWSLNNHLYLTNRYIYKEQGQIICTDFLGATRNWGPKFSITMRNKIHRRHAFGLGYG